MIGRGERPEPDGGGSSRSVNQRRHQLALKNREELSVEGVTNVDSFDDEAVIVETVQGIMIVRGEALHIKALNLESGQLSIEGMVSSLEYTGDRAGKKAKGVIGRLFK
ncbi:MAG TPA: sporulation protein YabP [Limnochordia bacterium]|nr:sporulation protein YabP [Limnochordia bacterium]